MNNPHQPESNEAQKLLHTEIKDRFLTMEDGRPSELHRLLKLLGCHIFTGKSAKSKMVTNDNPILSRTAKESIHYYIFTYEEDILLERHARDVNTGEDLHQRSGDIFDDSNLLSETGELLPQPLRNIADFVSNMGYMRIGDKGEVLRNEPSEKVKAYNEALTQAYTNIGVILAEQQLKMFDHIDRKDYVEGTSGDTRKKISLLIDLPPSRQKHESIKKEFQGKKFIAIYDLLTRTYHYDEEVPIKNTTLLNLFAQVRSLHRQLNRELEIDTRKELESITAKNTEIANAPKLRGRGRKIQRTLPNSRYPWNSPPAQS